jgi:hypothetical protein
VFVRRQLTEIILYGAHRNGADIDPDEEGELIPLAVGAGAACDHIEAQSLQAKIDVLTRENEQLRTELLARRPRGRVEKTT